MYLKSTAWLSLATTTTIAAAACTRPLLEEATSRYVAAQSAGEPRYLQQLAPDLVAMLYTENGNATMPLHASILAKPLRIDHARAQHDLEGCKGYVEVVVSDDAHPYQLATQIYLNAAAGTIDNIETLVTDAQDWLFSARHALHYVLQEDWSAIAPAERDEREVLRAAADAYLDLFSNSSVVVPWHDECSRLEGGLYTQPGSTCATGIPEGIEMVDRRYVIDEEYGTVGVFLRFGPSGLHDSHEFRIEGGRIKYIHTMTVCPTPNCGFGDPPAILQRDPGW